MIAKRAHEPLVLAGLFALVSVPTAQLWSPGRVLSGREVHRIYQPEAYALEHRARAWGLPEWEPEIACGQPFFGVTPSQLAYPPRWLQLVAGPDRTLALLCVFHQLWAAFCGFRLARARRRSLAAAAAAGFLCGATPLFLSSFVSVNLAWSSSWLPFILWMLERFREGRDARRIAFCGAAVGLQVLAGAPEVAVGSALVVALALFQTLPWRRALACAALAGAAAALLAAPELAALLSHAAQGPRRGSFSLEQASYWSLTWGDLGRLVVPRLSSAPDTFDGYAHAQLLLGCVYLGATTVLLAAWGARGGWRAWVPAAAALLWLSLGAKAGLFAAVHFLPGIRALRFPAKLALLLPALCSVGVADGVDALAAAPRRAGLALVPFAAVPFLAADPRARAAGLALLVLGAAVAWRGSPVLAAAALILDVGFASLALPLLEVSRREENAALLAALPPADPRERLADGLKGKDWFELMDAPSPGDALSAFAPNFPQAGGVRLTKGYGAQVSDRIAEVAARGGPGALDLMAARWALQRKGAAAEGEVVKDLGPALLVRRASPLPRGLFFPRWRVLPSEGAVRDAVLAPDFAPRTEALLEQDPGLGPPSAGEVQAASLDELAAERVALGLGRAEPGVAVLQDTWDPGWSATVDGRATPVLRVDYAFLGAAVPAGGQRVEFRYRSVPLRVGLGIAAVGWLGLAWFLSRRRAVAA